MKKYLILFFLMSCCVITLSFLCVFSAEAIYPVKDAMGIDLPRNLRTALQPIKIRSLNSQGLDRLKISGSGQFSEKVFMAMVRRLAISPEKLIIVDLREESHGFINGNPICWTDGIYNHANLHKKKSEIESDEYLRLKLAVQAKQIVINPLANPTRISVYEVKTEKNIVEEYGSIYVRLPVTDHSGPSHEVIDQFVELVKNLSSDQWVHVHCRAGKGRTTTFLALFDIMQNARYVSLKDILARQHLIGGIDLTKDKKNDAKKTQAAQERLELVQKFYLYCQEVPNFQMSWSNWLAKKGSK